MAKSPSPSAKQNTALAVHIFRVPILKLHVKIPNFFFNLIYSESCRFCAICYKNSSTLASILSDC